MARSRHAPAAVRTDVASGKKQTLDGEQGLYVSKPAEEVAAVEGRRQLSTVSMKPLRPFPIIRGGGEIERADEEVLRASPGDEPARPWGTYRIASATCLYPSMMLVTDDNQIIHETWTSPKSLRHVQEFSDIKREDIDALFAGAPFQARPLEAPKQLHGAYVLAGSAPQGYFHWVIEYLPNVALLRKTTGIRKYLPGAALLRRGRGQRKLLIPPVRHQWQKDTLSYLGLGPDEFVEVDQHVHVSGELTFADRIVPRESHISKSTVPFFRKLRNKVRRTGRRRLFVSRAAAGARHLTNEEAVLSQLERLGFERVEFGIAKLRGTGSIVRQRGDCRWTTRRRADQHRFLLPRHRGRGTQLFNVPIRWGYVLRRPVGTVRPAIRAGVGRCRQYPLARV